MDKSRSTPLMPYTRQAEKLSAARRCLMLPHSHGIEQSISDAFRECGLAFHRMDESGLNDKSRQWVTTIKEFMIVGAGSLSTNQQIELSRVVDELAHWFERKDSEDWTTNESRAGS